MPESTAFRTAGGRGLFLAFLAVFITFATLSGMAISHISLFGDEAFYWLESRHLAWSYTDVPGWTAWQAALAETIGGHSYLGLRWLSWLAGLCVPWLGFWLAWQSSDCIPTGTNPPDQSACSSTAYCSRLGMASLAGLLIMAIPLLQLIGILMLPDVWLLFFTLLLINGLFAAIRTGQRRWWILLAVTLAVAVNVHVRMWIWLFFAALSLLIVWPRWSFWRPLLRWLAPAALFGLLPVLVFNANNDWALFTFQFGRRHPWRFQPENMALIVAQIVLISPLVFGLWALYLRPLIQRQKNLPKTSLPPLWCRRLWRWVGLTALFHWLFYAITGLFADGLRTTVHWMLASYPPVLALAPVWWCHTCLQARQTRRKSRLIPTALISGLTLSLATVLWLSKPMTAHDWRSARILDNSSGWRTMAMEAQSTAESQGLTHLMADYFMTAAELGFELNRDDILALPHVKNVKHGRQAQLQLMDLLHSPDSPPPGPTLLVVEDSTLKLQDKNAYYQSLCHMPGSIRWLKDVITAQGFKKFALFKWSPGGAECQLPAIFYAEHQTTANGVDVSGWVVRHHIPGTHPTARQLFIRYQGAHGKWQKKAMANPKEINIGVARLFPTLNDPFMPEVGFKTHLPSGTRAYQILMREQTENGQWQPVHHSRLFLVD